MLKRQGRPLKHYAGPYKGIQRLEKGGRIYWYLRLPGGPRQKLPIPVGVEPDHPEFLEVYNSVRTGFAPIAQRFAGGTVAAAIDAFLDDPAHKRGKTGDLGERALEAQESYLRKSDGSLAKQVGDLMLAKVTAKDLQRLANLRTPSVQKKWKQAVVRLFAFATKQGLIETNPALGLDIDRAPETEGFLIWEETQCARYEGAYAEDSMERLAYALGHFIRRDDLSQLTWQDLKVITDVTTGVETEAFVFVPKKTAKKKLKATVTLTAPVLANVIRHHRRDGVAQVGPVLTRNGKPFTASSLGDFVAGAAEAAGVAGRKDDNGTFRRYTLHGLRKTCTCAMLAHGVAHQQIMGAMGWASPEQIGTYGKKYDREITTVRGMQRWAESAKVAA